MILDVWERGLREPLQRQVVALLAAARPGASYAEIAALPLGMRDSMLLDLREQLFGPEVATIAACPGCGEVLEAAFALADVRLPRSRPAEADLALETAEHRVRFRLPATDDLLAIPEGADAAGARAILLERCVTEASDSQGRPLDALPAALEPAVAEGMAEADPQALVELQLECAGCGQPFQAVFDIASFLMREIHAWAQQMLGDIDSLARAYGWHEAEILALSPLRRRIYLDLVAR
jgi:uncharacterized protein (UPF0212 family)